MSRLPLRVAVISPLRDRTVQAHGEPVRHFTQRENEARAMALCQDLTRAGFAAFAPHVFYPRFLDDTVTADRAAGMSAGKAWLRVAEVAVVDARLGYSEGMRDEIAFCETFGIPTVIWQEDGTTIPWLRKVFGGNDGTA